jgi:hypothetical protein
MTWSNHGLDVLVIAEDKLISVGQDDPQIPCIAKT